MMTTSAHFFPKLAYLVLGLPNWLTNCCTLDKIQPVYRRERKANLRASHPGYLPRKESQQP